MMIEGPFSKIHFHCTSNIYHLLLEVPDLIKKITIRQSTKAIEKFYNVLSWGGGIHPLPWHLILQLPELAHQCIKLPLRAFDAFFYEIGIFSESGDPVNVDPIHSAASTTSTSSMIISRDIYVLVYPSST